MKVWIHDYRPAPAGWQWVQTAAEAILLLKEEIVTEITFGEIVSEGYKVAEWIENAARENALPYLTWYVQTIHPITSRKIRYALESAGRFWKKCERSKNSKNL